MDYPTDDRDPLETSLQNDAHISVGVHKVGQAPGIPPVCIDLKVVRWTSPQGVSCLGSYGLGDSRSEPT
jgi:hypothetical protein